MEKKGKTVKITPELIIELKKPLGIFYEGSIEETIAAVKKYFNEHADETPPLIISVGDICTRSLLEAGIKIDIAVIDGKTLRTSDEVVNFPTKKILKITNKKGFIEKDAWSVFEYAIKNEEKPILIQVNGEEDLLTLIAVLESPLDSIVFYGQPPIESYNMKQGLVMILVTPEKKEEFVGYLERMDLIEDPN
ncbi:MAG: GTP-dependent dephospho-CoA kinase family protein [Candidatus Helarchaeota archaeon]